MPSFAPFGALNPRITAVLTHGSARIDAILLVHGRRQDLADLAYAFAGSAERATEMRDQGAAFGQTVAR